METRNTIQRSLVIQAVEQLHHPTADEVYNFINGSHPTVSKGTVYRNLHVLVDSGKLRRVSLPDGADRFDITLERHYHVRCRICGRVADVDLPYQDALLAQIPRTEGFLIEDHDIVLRGLCETCREKNKSVG